MARTTKEQMARTSEAIITVATSAFAELGYGAVALEDVAAAAGVTRGALYHRYRSKSELFVEVLGQVMASVGKRVEAAADAEDDLVAQLEAGGVEFVRAALESGVRQIMLVDGPAVVGWEQWRAMDSRHSRRALEEGLVALQDAGGLPGLEPEAVAVLLSGALNEAALHVADADDQERALEAVVGGYRAMLHAIVGK